MFVQMFKNTILSSQYTRANCHFIVNNTTANVRQNVPGALRNPNEFFRILSEPGCEMKAISSRFVSFISTYRKVGLRQLWRISGHRLICQYARLYLIWDRNRVHDRFDLSIVATKVCWSFILCSNQNESGLFRVGWFENFHFFMFPISLFPKLT